VFEVASSSGPLIEPGQYVLTLAEIEDAGVGQYGPSILWKWKMSTPSAPDSFTVDADSGEPYLFYAYSSTKMTPKARARHWAEALLNREIQDGQKIDPSSLVGERMQALVIHETAEDGTVRAKISREMRPKPLRATPPATKSATATKGAPAAQFIPASPFGGEALREAIKKALRKCVLLDVPSLESFDIDVTAFDDETLRLMLNQMLAEIDEAAAAAA